MASFSDRLPRHDSINELTRTLDEMRASGTPVVDLTESNPTRVDLPYPPGLLAALAHPDALVYDPRPLGRWDTRAAIAADAARRGAAIDPANVVLSASTSEAYSWLFKLLCNPGDSVLVPRPSYPLFEHLTALEGVRTVPYALDYHRRWDIDTDTLNDAPASTRAVLVVSPNNPTGSYVSARDLEHLVRVCRERHWALIVDEVFADYRLDATHPITDICARADVLTFTLGGASKTLALPQLKLGWIIVGGPAAERLRALSGLELIADTFLSVNTPVQVAASRLLRELTPVREAIQQRTRTNLGSARIIAQQYPSCEVLVTEGGWSMVIRVPALRSEEHLVLDLLRRERILVHPGYFFDFPREAFLVVSLLPREVVITDTLPRLFAFAAG